MMNLYYCPYACSMASHVALEEAGASFHAKKINIFTGDQKKSEYLAINPRALVPALEFDNGQVLLESTAILGWIGHAYPEKALLGSSPLEHALTISMCAWLSGTVHTTFKRFIHPEDVNADKDTWTGIKTKARDSYWGHLKEIDAKLANQPWIMGDRFTLADPYVLVFYPWCRDLDLPIEELTNLAAMKDRLVARPAAHRALAREKSVLLKM
ncbi:glutathione S-transferase [Paracoccus liaowanqingii]|uniref:Glutathione S-transferase n=1 Tax=Paracoccus liaowanqingii TaxID=2560053 RepID=A0A4Z1CCN6_9RHOB|nr:glutathione S-transferase N-terminal domain-containing protein [Paracoccus liaowanqingii]TGN61753.1 glutathione S-transferase [Paracoccus liaowanqingii]